MYGELPEVTVNGDKVRGVTVRVPNPPKQAVLRLPTSAEMLEYVRSIGRVTRRKTAEPDLKPDQVLFAKLRLDDGPEFDEYEASRAVGGIVDQNIIDTQRANGRYLVTLGTPFGEVVHTVDIPTQKAVVQYRRAISKSTARIDVMEHAVALFDGITRGAEGYADGVEVPLNHKSAVVQAALAALDDLDPVIDPNL